MFFAEEVDESFGEDVGAAGVFDEFAEHGAQADEKGNGAECFGEAFGQGGDDVAGGYAGGEGGEEADEDEGEECVEAESYDEDEDDGDGCGCDAK